MVLFLAQVAEAQQADSLIAAEKAFARMAVEKTIRVAFLSNLDSNGVTFNQGKIVNGLQQFTGMKESSLKLLWQPAYACLSSSGEIGFTTGPYEVRKTMDSAVLAAGQYSSVWKKNARGEWKLLVDLGTDYKASLYNGAAGTASFTGLVPVVDTSSNPWEVETAFLKAYSDHGVAAFDSVIREGFWFNLQHQHPLTSKVAIRQALNSLPANLVFKPAGGGVSSARDMVYVYGEVENGGKQENYLRVWVHTAKGWMILLQVLRW